MEPWIIDLMKTIPALGVIVWIVREGMKWHREMASEWLSSFKEVGSKCHEAHERVSTMFHEQSCKGQEVLTANVDVVARNTVQLERCANAHEEQNRIIRGRTI